MYEYDPLGRRIAKSKLNKQGEKQCHTQFIWAGSHLVQEIRKGNHQQNAEKTDRTFTYIYTHPDSYEPLAQCYKEGDNAEHTVNYFHCDQIGIPREMTDSQGKLIWKGRYGAWGQLIHDSNRHAQRTTHQPFRLQNQYFDQETGLHYNFLRYYEPALGRFITQDPIGLMGGMNLYQFAANTQIWIDPLGLARFCTRPLSGAPWGVHTDFDKNYRQGLDLGLFHEHIFFEDGSNIGYTTTGTFSERSRVGYKCSDKNYDDTIMKQAVNNVKNKKVRYLEKTDDGRLVVKEKLRFGKNDYNVLTNNCQDFSTEVEKEYYKLEKWKK